MSAAEPLLKSLLDWWRLAGVTSAETDAILAAPVVKQALERDRVPTPTVRKARPVRAQEADETAGIAEARRLAAAADDLPALEAALRAFDGLKDLRRGARGPVFMDGVVGAPVLVIGEAPGREEDEAGKPFVGASGRLLDRMLGSIGFSRTENVALTNVVFWRAAANRPAKPTEIATCFPFVERLITLSKPKLLLLTGGSAAASVLKRDDGIISLHGKQLSAVIPGLTEPLHVMVTLNPANVLRRPQDKRLAWRDLCAFAAWADELSVPRGQEL
jgi:DNA polymerase